MKRTRIRKIISLGVGVQSTALYYMSSYKLLPRVDFTIFANTGGEKASTLKYFEYLKKWFVENNGIKLYEANYLNLEKDLLNTNKGRFASIPAFTKNDDGSTAMLRRQCTGEYKIAQFNKKYREIIGLESGKRFPKTEVYIGISREEMGRMQVPKEKWKIHVYPFCGWKIYPDGKSERFPDFIMHRQQIIDWYYQNNLPIPEKSACKFCPFQSEESWLSSKENAPDEFKTSCLIDKVIRNSTKKGIQQPIYLHDSLKPLDQVKFKRKKKGFFDSKGNCSDYCDI